MTKKTIIAPSILSADFSNLRKDVESVEKAGAEWLHIDVMDGSFVPNISIGPVVIKWLRPLSKMFFDVHLMIKNPDKYWEVFKANGADLIVFHTEAECDIKKLIENIKKSGIKVGLSLKPGTDEKVVVDNIENLDVVLVMTVEPGFGGQKFMESMIPRIERFRRVIDEKKISCCLEVDGGINAETALKAVKAGADAVVAGNYVFGGKDPGQNVRILKNLIDKQGA